MHFLGNSIHHTSLMLVVMFTLLVGQITPPLHAMPLKSSITHASNAVPKSIGKQNEARSRHPQAEDLHSAPPLYSSSPSCHTAMSEGTAMSGTTAMSEETPLRAENAVVSSSSTFAHQLNHSGAMLTLDSSEDNDCCGTNCQCPEGICAVSIALIESGSPLTFISTSQVTALTSVGLPIPAVSSQYRPPKTILS